MFYLKKKGLVNYTYFWLRCSKIFHF